MGRFLVSICVFPPSARSVILTVDGRDGDLYDGYRTQPDFRMSSTRNHLQAGSVCI